MEYYALLIRMYVPEHIGVRYLKAYSDSKLIVNQVRGEYEIRHEDLVSYQNATINMAEKHKKFYINHVPRQQNAHANALAFLPASLALPAGATEEVIVHSHDLYCLRFTLEDSQTLEDVQVNEVL